MRLLLIIGVFFVLSALLIISNNHLAMYKEGNGQKFADLYSDWLGQVYDNIHFITGQVVKLDWVPDK